MPATLKTKTKSGRISWERFEKDFPLVKNHLDKNASGDGCMFETYDKELEFVKAANPECVLTLVDDGEHSIIVPGFHFVNRMGYFITKKPIHYDFWVRY